MHLSIISLLSGFVMRWLEMVGLGGRMGSSLWKWCISAKLNDWVVWTEVDSSTVRKHFRFCLYEMLRNGRCFAACGYCVHHKPYLCSSPLRAHSRNMCCVTRVRGVTSRCWCIWRNRSVDQNTNLIAPEPHAFFGVDLCQRIYSQPHKKLPFIPLFVDIRYHK